MLIDIYRSQYRKEKFIILKSGVEPDKVLPPSLREELSTLTLYRSNKEITEEHNIKDPLLVVSSNDVIRNINNNNYYLQSIPVKSKTPDISEAGAAIGGGILAASLGMGPVGAFIGAVLGFLLAQKGMEKKNDSFRPEVIN